MTVSLDATWTAAYQQDSVEPRFQVAIYDGTTTWTAYDAPMGASSGVTGEQVAIYEVAPMGVKLDPLTREVQLASCSVKVDYDWIKDIVVNNRLKGQQITIKIGAKELATSAFANYFIGSISKVVPSGDGRFVELECLVELETLLAAEITGYWLNKHPLQVISNPARIVGLGFNGTGLEDITLGGTYTGTVVTNYLVKIDGTGTPDTFEWSKDNGATWEAQTVSITGAAQTLDQGVTITFGATTGHTDNDEWKFKAYPGDGILEKAGVPSSRIDSSAFDPSDAVYSAISHYVVTLGGAYDSAHSEDTIREPMVAKDVLDEICQLLNGHIVVQEDGAISFKLFDSTAAAVADWTADDIKSLEQLEDGEEVINRVEVLFQESKGDFGEKYAEEDTDSQSDYAFPGESARYGVMRIETRWLNYITQAYGASFASLGSGDTTMILSNKTPLGLCGTREGYPSGSQPADAKLSASRPAYILIRQIGTQGYTGVSEIVKCTTALTAGTRFAQINVLRPGDNAFVTEGPFIWDWTYTVARAQKGTTASAFTVPNYAFDITIIVDLAQALLARHGDGLRMIEVETSFAEFDKQIGDLVTVTWPQYLSYGFDGLTSSDKWEIVGKEPDRYASPPRILWTLAYAGVKVPTYNQQTDMGSRYGDFAFWTIRAEERGESAGHNAKKDGLGITPTETFEADVAAGAVGSIGNHKQNGADMSYVFSASKDTWVGMSTNSGLIFFIEVPNSDPEPTIDADETWLGTVVTDASGITSVDTSMVEDKYFDGQKVVAQSIDTAELASEATTGPKIAGGAVSVYQQNNREQKHGGGNILPNFFFEQASRG